MLVNNYDNARFSTSLKGSVGSNKNASYYKIPDVI